MRLYKRLSDLLLSAVGLIALSPVFVITAILIKATSPGSVLYTADRIGYKGKRFRFLKFRSLKTGADQDKNRSVIAEEYVRNEKSGLPSKIVNKEYFTPIGRFIRKWGIDELPQLFNVIKGDMSIVGPRPSPTGEYLANDEWHKKRFDIKPGCTGLWKLYASKNKTGTFNNTVIHDIYYARNMNPMLDIYIILKTVRIILSGRVDI